MKRLFICLAFLGLVTLSGCTPDRNLQPEDLAIDQENVPGNNGEDDEEDDS